MIYKKYEKYIPYLITILVSVFFFRISNLTPLAGDDWGYALNGVQSNPFVLAYQFYFSWSGRFFSELYGFLVTPHKEFWNILNALLFGSLFILIIKLTTKKKYGFSSLILFFLMISIKDELRMETYTWLMGTTYVIPLVLCLINFLIIKTKIVETMSISKPLMILISVITLYIGLTMENIAITYLFSQILILIYLWLSEKKLNKFIGLQVLLSTISFTILRLSPGANYRLLRDHTSWIELGLLKQLVFNYPNFINYTFIQNKNLVLTFSIVVLILIGQYFFSHKKYRLTLIFLTPIFLISALSSMALTLQKISIFIFIQPMTISSSLFSLFFWPVFIIATIYLIWSILDIPNKEYVLFFILLSGLSNGAMMLSPIFGYRSSLYTVYFMFTAILLISQALVLPNKVSIIINIILVSLIFRYSTSLIYKYELVARVDRMRLSQIYYYQDHPEVIEVWLIRYPFFTIHAGDIEVDDTYHMDTFKEYFNLNPKQNLIFYFPETSYEDYLLSEGW